MALLIRGEGAVPQGSSRESLKGRVPRASKEVAENSREGRDHQIKATSIQGPFLWPCALSATHFTLSWSSLIFYVFSQGLPEPDAVCGSSSHSRICPFLRQYSSPERILRRF